MVVLRAFALGGLVMVTLFSTIVARVSVVIDISPSNCTQLLSGGPSAVLDCYDVFQQAARACVGVRGCEIRLQRGAEYPVSCPPGDRPSTTQIELPAVHLVDLHDAVFGAPDDGGNSEGVAVDARGRFRQREIFLGHLRLPHGWLSTQRLKHEQYDMYIVLCVVSLHGTSIYERCKQ